MDVANFEKYLQEKGSKLVKTRTSWQRCELGESNLRDWLGVVASGKDTAYELRYFQINSQDDEHTD